jgi:hypothetical protein
MESRLQRIAFKEVVAMEYPYLHMANGLIVSMVFKQELSWPIRLAQLRLRIAFNDLANMIV